MTIICEIVAYVKRCYEKEDVNLIYTDNSDGEQEESEGARRWVAKEFGDIGEVKLLRA